MDVDAEDLIYIIGELYIGRRRDKQLIDQLTSQRDSLKERVDELEAEKEAGT